VPQYRQTKEHRSVGVYIPQVGFDSMFPVVEPAILGNSAAMIDNIWLVIVK